MTQDIGKPIFKKFRRYKYLSDILGRLQDETGSALKYYNRHNSKALINNGRLIGFWSGPRLLFPVVEAVSKASGKTKWDFLSQDLGIKPSSLVWQMFRNSLIHNDLLLYAKYKQRKVKWGARMDGKNHVIEKRKVHIDIITLYKNLVDFLTTEIDKKDKTYINVQVGIDYSNETRKEARFVIDDINKL
ncbi:hypothetical protein HY008_00045 [Candidatus Woesebacteria bacterium]|nr:hypothetical protein [Candidatus Woesebacteria bacterium]